MKACLLHSREHIVRQLRTDPDGFVQCADWYAGLYAKRTAFQTLIWIDATLISQTGPNRPRTYRNPVIFARDLYQELVRDELSRRQLAQRHGVSSDRITQWLCLLKMPEETLREIEELGDYWDRQVVTERKLRRIRRTTDSQP